MPKKLCVAPSGLLWLASVVGGLAVGCNDGLPPRYPVSGQVEFPTGDPVRNATIEFVPIAGGPSPRGRIDSDGNFVLGTYAADDGAPAGEYQVLVLQALPPNALQAIRGLGEDHAAHAQTVSVVSLKHASLETSGLVETVEAIDQNDLIIVVEAR